MRLRALLATDSLGLRLLGGEAELDRTVTGVMTTDLRDPSRYLSGGELVLTGLAWRRSSEDSESFVRIVDEAGVAGLAAGEAELGAVPDDLIVACAKHRLPLFAVTEAVAFATITEHIVRQVSTERAGDLAAVVDRHRRLMSAGPAGGGPDAVLDLLHTDLDLRAWVVSPTGRQVAGQDGVGELPPALRTELAAAHLAARRADRQAPVRTRIDGVPYALFPVGGTEAAPTGRDALLSDWFLAAAADTSDWPAERLDLLHGVTQLIAAERDRRDAARTVRRRLAKEVLDLVAGGAPPAEVAARLRVAAPVLLPRLGTAPYWQVVVAALEWNDDADAGTAPTGGPTARALLEEVLADPGIPGAEAGVDRVAVTHERDEALALLPFPAYPDEDPEQGGHPRAGLRAEELQRAAGGSLASGLGGEGRLTLGFSSLIRSADSLRGAVEEARHARRVAAARTGAVSAAGHEELASHVLLLPFVPDDVRRAFTSRLLDPLHDYDRRHRAELVATLETFLASDGSWTRCANRLHLHVNTLRYRVGRIEQLTGRDLARLEDKLDFFLALRMS